MAFAVKVVLDSVSAATGVRIASVAATYPRFIHSEIMTHRDRSRNAASSRAIPWKKTEKDGKLVPNCMFNMVMTDPVIPEYLGLEQRGMQAGEELEGEARTRAISIIKEMRDFNLKKCDELAALNLHKSVINRYVEPWMWITTLMTATEWANFFRLRVHPAAERHFQKVAKMIKQALRESKPQTVHPGNWHLPYIYPEDEEALRVVIREYKPATADEQAIERESDLRNLLIRKVSAGRCARLSYLTHEGKRDLIEDIKLANKLIYPKTADLDDDVIHASPLEHVARPLPVAGYWSGPFNSWHQFRKDFSNENVPGFGNLED